MTESTRSRLQDYMEELVGGMSSDELAESAACFLADEIDRLRAEMDKHPAPHVSVERPWFANWRGQSVEMVEGSTYAFSDGAIYRIMGDDGGDLGDHAPVDPTPAMIEAGKGIEIEGLDGCLNPEELVAVWRAMEAAKRT